MKLIIKRNKRIGFIVYRRIHPLVLQIHTINLTHYSIYKATCLQLVSGEAAQETLDAAPAPHAAVVRGAHSIIRSLHSQYPMGGHFWIAKILLIKAVRKV